MIESGIDFCFSESYNVVKFDETAFYSPNENNLR